MNPRLRRLAAVLWCLPVLITVRGDTPFDAPGNFNPLVPGYFADPTVKQFDGTFYLYTTTDGNGGGRGPATVWVSKDFVDWVLVPMNWPTTAHYWAPDVVRRGDRRFYLYYNQPCNTYGGVSDAPIGPWTPLTPGEGLVIPDRLVKDVITLDTQLFEDTDGTLYGYWGTWGIFANSGCGFGVFRPDMKTFERLGMIPNTQARDFFEAPFMLERNGVYYFTYSSGSCHDASYRVQYAVGRRPDDAFVMGPNNPILATTADGRVHGPGHHSILQQGDDYFIVYHRHDLPVTPNGMHRQTCADRLVFEGDGVIRKVEPTHQGIGFLGENSRPANLAFTRKVSASSFYRDTVRHHDYRPEYAVDDNNATLWRPGDNRAGHWLTVDLGNPQRIRRTHTQFEYATWSYQYLIEASLDGRNWAPFADRRQNTRWGSPMVDDGDVEARYLRITVTGTEFPGLFGAIWNFKAYAAAPHDPLLAMADGAWAACLAHRPSDGGQPAVRVASGEALTAPSKPPSTTAPRIHLDAEVLQLGASIASWTNLGTLGGAFRAAEIQPRVSLASGRKAVRFSGREILTASFPAPRSLAGNSSFTVAAWVHNPEIADSECLISWAGRGGPDATTAQFGYGSQREFGAVGHWGFADMGWGGRPPEAGVWHHLAVVFDGVIERVYVDGELNNAEAKMLLMHEGRPIHVGASEPGTEFFSGTVASLRVYDVALSETEVQNLAADAPSADVLIHVDAAQLDFGPLKLWKNGGSVGGTFTTEGAGPVVADVNGRMAVRFEPGQSLQLALGADRPLNEFTLMVDVARSSADAGGAAVGLTDDAGKYSAFPVTQSDSGWQQHVWVCRGGVGVWFRDGVPDQRVVAAGPTALRTLHLGGRDSFSGALSRVQLFGRALSRQEVFQLHAVWKQDRQTPSPNPPGFAQPPTALHPTVVVMGAPIGRSEAGGVEYHFAEITGHPGGDSSGWTSNPFFLDDGLLPNTRYAYRVTLRDLRGNLTTASAPVAAATDEQDFTVRADPLSEARDFLAAGTQGTLWDGFLGEVEGSSPECIANQNGALRLQSSGTVWDGGRPYGPFLFRMVSGDFAAQVEVADYAGWDDRRVPGNNDGGLMVRLPDVNDAGPGEDLVQLNFFPIWNQGNMVTRIDRGGRSQQGNALAWEAHRHLQILRQGELFFFRTSSDGQRWTDMPGSPVRRRDMLNRPLQVGLYHASYGAESSHVAFKNFCLVERRGGSSPAR